MFCFFGSTCLDVQISGKFIYKLYEKTVVIDMPQMCQILMKILIKSHFYINEQIFDVPVL